MNTTSIMLYTSTLGVKYKGNQSAWCEQQLHPNSSNPANEQNDLSRICSSHKIVNDGSILDHKLDKIFRKYSS